MSLGDPGASLSVVLTEPAPLPNPYRVTEGEFFSISADVTLTNLAQCHVLLRFDSSIFEEVSGADNPQPLQAATSAAGNGSWAGKTFTLSWRLHAKSRTQTPASVRVEAQSGAVFQLALLQVEVTH